MSNYKYFEWPSGINFGEQVDVDSIKSLKQSRDEINSLLKKIGNKVCDDAVIANIEEVKTAYSKNVLSDKAINEQYGTSSRAAEAIEVLKALQQCLGTTNSFGRRVLYRGSRGGVYYKSKGRKVYVNQFGL